MNFTCRRLGNGTSLNVDVSDTAVTLSVGPDCNGNCLDDSTEVAEGLVRDWNVNGVPDECDDYGDFNHNGRVDIVDYALFTVCLADPGVAASPGCKPFNFAPDSDVDLADFAELQVRFGN